jgi:cell division protein ZapA
MEHSVQIEIFGMSYSIKTKEDPDYTKRIASYINQKMYEITQNAQLVSTNKIAVLASINIADELFKEKKKGTIELEDLLKRSENLIDLIDSINEV